MKAYKLRLGLLIFLFLLAAFSAYLAFNEENEGILTVAFLDVGQGDAIFVESPDGNQLLIDGGPGRSVLRELSKVMPFYDRSIDVLLASHPDSDHISGLNDVFEKYKVSLYIESGVDSESAIDDELRKKIVSEGAASVKARRGMFVDLGRGAVLQIFFPDRDPSGMETNTSSIVARLVYGESEFLFTGDSPKIIEQYLVSLEENYQGESLVLKSDVLKVGHHGSKTSSGAGFIAAVSPKYAVISAGKDNRYGHPNQEVLDTLNNFGTQILRTDELGRIIFKSDGTSLEIK